MAEMEERVTLPALLDVKQVAEYLGLHRVTVVDFARSGRLPAFKVGREWRFRADEIRAWMDEQRRGPVRDDRFERLWEKLAAPARAAAADMEDINELLAEIRGERKEEEETATGEAEEEEEGDAKRASAADEENGDAERAPNSAVEAAGE